MDRSVQLHKTAKDAKDGQRQGERRQKRGQKTRKTTNAVVIHFYYIFSRKIDVLQCFNVLFCLHERYYKSKFIQEPKNRDALRDNDMRNKNM